MMTTNKKNASVLSPKELDSTKEIRRILNNRTNPDEQTHEAVLSQQAHLNNFQRQRIMNFKGLREVSLQRNKLGSRFAQGLI